MLILAHRLITLAVRSHAYIQYRVLWIPNDFGCCSCTFFPPLLFLIKCHFTDGRGNPVQRTIISRRVKLNDNTNVNVVILDGDDNGGAGHGLRGLTFSCMVADVKSICI